MSEIDREKLVAWGRERLNQLKKNRDVRVTMDYVDGYIDAFEECLHEIQSGAFDADNSEVQRLRSAIKKAISMWPNTCDFADPEDVIEKMIAYLNEALSGARKKEEPSMTRNEVLALKPGRELDALVAEKVMGWVEFSPIDPTIDFGVHGKYRWNYAKDPKDSKQKPIPLYSEDIADAFEAETKVIEKDPSMYVHALASVVFGHSQVQDISDVRKMCMLIHATPEQRCKAALLAVMDGDE